MSQLPRYTRAARKKKDETLQADQLIGSLLEELKTMLQEELVPVIATREDLVDVLENIRENARISMEVDFHSFKSRVGEQQNPADEADE